MVYLYFFVTNIDIFLFSAQQTRVLVTSIAKDTLNLSIKTSNLVTSLFYDNVKVHYFLSGSWCAKRLSDFQTHKHETFDWDTVIDFSVVSHEMPYISIYGTKCQLAQNVDMYSLTEYASPCLQYPNSFVHVNDKFYVTEPTQDKIDCYSEKLKHTYSFENSIDIRQPKAITYFEGFVVVITKDKLCLYNLSNDTYKLHQIIIGHFSGVASSLDYLFTTLAENKEVKLVRLKRFGEVFKKSTFTTSLCDLVKVSHLDYGNMIVWGSCIESNRIFSIDTASTDVKFSRSDLLKRPQGVKWYTEGILVCDSSNHRIVRFDEKLQCLSVIYENFDLLHPMSIFILNETFYVLYQFRRGIEGTRYGTVAKLERAQDESVFT